jgi:hypothetical protein
MTDPICNERGIPQSECPPFCPHDFGADGPDGFTRLAGDEAYDRLHGVDGHTQAVTPGRIPPVNHEHDATGCLECGCNAAPWSNTRHTAPCTCEPTHAPAGEEPCPTCGGSMRFCECMDDPFAPMPDAGLEAVREAFALGAAWALGDDEEAPTVLKERIAEAECLLHMTMDARDRAERRVEAAEALADEWERAAADGGPRNYAASLFATAARDLRAALGDEPPKCVGLCGEHHWLDRPESDTRECLICGVDG